MSMSVSASLAGGLVIAFALSTLHWLAPRIERLPLVPARAMGSFAGGIAIAYVFLQLLPALAEGSTGIGEALDDTITLTPLVDLFIFVVALTGFTVFYGLDRLAHAAAGTTPGTTVSTEPPPGVFYAHLGAFCLYNALITYTMPLRLRTGVAFALLFTVAMGLHFVLTDRNLRQHYPIRFRRIGRVALASSLLAGWVAAVAAAPTKTLVVSLLTAFLGGSVLLNVFTEQLPSGPTSSFGWFVGGLVLYAALLSLATAYTA